MGPDRPDHSQSAQRKRRGRFRWSILAVGLLLSVALHVGYVIPKVIAPLLERPPEQLEVAYVPEEELKAAPPESPSAERAHTREKVAAEKRRPLAKAPEVAQVEPPKPTPQPVKPEPLPPPPPPPDPHKQMVDQDKFQEEEDNPEARFLAQRNHRAKEETRAKATNLIREVEGGEHPPESEPHHSDQDHAGAAKEKIAELENHPGAPKSMPRSSPMHGNEGQTVGTTPPKPGPLSMRDLTPKSLVAPSAQRREGLEQQEVGDGPLPMARSGEAQERAAGMKKGGRANLALDHHNYDNIEGFATAEKERREAARAEASHPQGRYQRYLGKVQALRSSIENFVFDVKPGNQSELGTRANPFAAYITAVHRQIHKLWAFGFLSDIEGKIGQKTPYDDPQLWTQLGIVIKSDGSVEKVGILRSSGVLAFDAAAIDSVTSAAPFPRPPQVIKSRNGKVYLDWQFHRDESACSPIYATPHILTTPGAEEDSGESTLPRPSRPLREGPRTLSREPKSQPEAAAPVTTGLPAGVVPEITPEAHAAAEGWFAAYSRGDSAWLAGWSATPFQAAGEVVAKDATKLKAMYKQLLAEAPSERKVAGLDLFTPAGIRGRLGGLPPGGEDTGMLFAVGKAGKEEFILLLKRSNQGWRVCGIDR